MFFPPTSHPPSAPVLDAHPIHLAVSRELYLLGQRAETFRVELEQERQLQLQGVAKLPPWWTAYIEYERQLILDKIQWIESREELFTSSAPHTLPSIRGHNTSTRGLHPTISSFRREESTHPFFPSENEGNVCSPSHVHLTTDSISSTVHGHSYTDERIRQSPVIATGSLSVDHDSTQRDSPHRTASTSRGTDPRRIERAHYQPQAGMFNGAQSITISGGVFNFIQGSVSSTADEMLELERGYHEG